MSDSFARLSDEDLLARLRAGERDGFGTLVRRYERELYGYLRRYLGNDDLAADVFQNTFLAVFRKIGHYEPGRPARPWLYAVATNQAIDATRRRARADRTAESLPDDADEGKTLADLLASREPDPADSAATAEVRARVRDAVAALPELLRQVIVLAYFQGLKYQDIATTLEIPVGTVKSRLHAAVAKLTAAWDPVRATE